MGAFGDGAKLKHIAEYGDFFSAGGQLPGRKGLKRGPHGIGVGVVAVLHHGDAPAQSHFLAHAGGFEIPEGGGALLRRYIRGCSCAEPRESVEHVVSAYAGDPGMEASAFADNVKIGRPITLGDVFRSYIRGFIPNSIVYYIKLRKANILEHIVVFI